MAEVTDEDLARKRERVSKLRDQLAEAEATRTNRVLDTDREIEAARLDAEEKRLEAQLSQAKEAAKVSVVKEGASGPLAQAKEQMKQAEAQSAARAKTDKE